MFAWEFPDPFSPAVVVHAELAASSSLQQVAVALDRFHVKRVDDSFWNPLIASGTMGPV